MSSITTELSESPAIPRQWIVTGGRLALAIALLEGRGFTSIDFSVLHPGGKLGALLKYTRDLMHSGDAVPLKPLGTKMSDALVEMTSKGFGCVGIVDSRGHLAGIVTDGGFRDSPEIALMAIPAYHSRPSAPTNLTVHQALDINVPIGCGDAPVWPGDVVVGDGEGVVVIPAHLADEIADEATEMTAFEDFVTERVQEGQSILGLYPPTDERNRDAFAAWRKAKGR